MQKLNIEEKLKVVARALWEDGKDDPDYDLRSYDEQYDEMLEAWRKGGLSDSFINACYEMQFEDAP